MRQAIIWNNADPIHHNSVPYTNYETIHVIVFFGIGSFTDS